MDGYSFSRSSRSFFSFCLIAKRLAGISFSCLPSLPRGEDGQQNVGGWHKTTAFLLRFRSSAANGRAIPAIAREMLDIQSASQPASQPTSRKGSETKRKRLLYLCAPISSFRCSCNFSPILEGREQAWSSSECAFPLLLKLVYVARIFNGSTTVQRLTHPCRDLAQIRTHSLARCV